MIAGAAPKADPRDGIILHVRDLRAFAMSLTRNHAAADDLVQDTIVKAWSKFDKFTPGTDLRAWMFTILRNTFYSGRRKVSREVADPEGIHVGSLSVLPQHDGTLAFGEFLRAFNQLSAEHREVLILVGANGYSYEEAASMTGVAIGTAKSRASRARALLCALMGMDAPTGNPVLAEASALAVVFQSRLAVA
ncbi:MAG: sigma-70 family RNA polymerase sigma factor [Paracoccaceae bacterium]